MKRKNDKASLCYRKTRSSKAKSSRSLYPPLQKKGSNSKNSSKLPVNVLGGSTVSGLDLDHGASWSLGLGSDDRPGLNSGADSALWSDKDGRGGVSSWFSSDSGNVSGNWSNGLSGRSEGGTCSGHDRLADLITNGGNKSVNNSWRPFVTRDVGSSLSGFSVDGAEGLAGYVTDGSNGSLDHLSL